MTTMTSKLVVSLLDRFSGPARGIGASIDALQRRASRTSSALLGGAGVGMGVRNLVALGAGYVGVTKGIGGTVGAAIRFEEAFADVRKVVDGTPGQLQQIRHEILSMSKTMPTTAEGLAAIYAAAGQSNIPINELGKFSKMVAQVAVAWETTEGETSDALAKIKTQLGLNVDQIGLYADAINHLSNNTASAAPNLVEFSRSVAANGEMFGFTATQTLAFGSAMISAGGESEVAATSFRNMGRALTKGTQATKQNRIAFNRLGLDAVGTAKNMQKNALGTTLDVLDRIGKLPEWEQISIASALFGDEARALMPVIANSSELRRQLGMVGDEAKYAGSAVAEFKVRAETTGSVLETLGNKFRAAGIETGDRWLPTIKAAADGLGDVLDTMGKRIGILDTVGVAFESLMSGMGGKGGGIRQLINDLGDLFLGKAFDDGGKLGAVDERANELARTSNTFRQIGRDVREFMKAVGDGNFGVALGNLGDAFSNMSGSMTVTGALALGLVGRGLMGIAAGAMALWLSPIGQIATVAVGVAALIDAAKDASSLGEFVEHLKALSTVQLGAIALTLGIVGTKVFRLGRSLQSLYRIFRPKGAPGAPPTPPAGKPAGGSSAPGSGGPGRGTAKPGPWSPKPNGPTVVPRGPTGTPVSRPPVPAPLMDLRPVTSSIVAPVLKNILKGGLAGLASWGGEALMGAGFSKLSEKLAQWFPETYTPEARAKAQEIGDKSIVEQAGSLLKSLFSGAIERGDANRGQDLNGVWDAIRSIPSLMPPPSTGPEDVSLVGTPPVMVAGPVTTQPSGVQAVRVTNPTPAPNITINVTSPSSDPAAIASAVKRQLSAELAALSSGAYSDG